MNAILQTHLTRWTSRDIDSLLALTEEPETGANQNEDGLDIAACTLRGLLRRPELLDEAA